MNPPGLHFTTTLVHVLTSNQPYKATERKELEGANMTAWAAKEVHRLRPTCDKSGDWKPEVYFNYFTDGKAKRDCAAELKLGLQSRGGW